MLRHKWIIRYNIEHRVLTIFHFKPKENIMSLEQARLFIERMKLDEAFAKRVRAIEDVAGRLACIQNEGFACNEAEINDVAGELSDTELDSVAGGRKVCDENNEKNNNFGNRW